MTERSERGSEQPHAQYSLLGTQYAALDARSLDEAVSPPDDLAVPSPLRAWCYLVLLSLQRQARVRQRSLPR